MSFRNLGDFCKGWKMFCDPRNFMAVTQSHEGLIWKMIFRISIILVIFRCKRRSFFWGVLQLLKSETRLVELGRLLLEKKTWNLANASPQRNSGESQMTQIRIFQFKRVNHDNSCPWFATFHQYVDYLPDSVFLSNSHVPSMLLLTNTTNMDVFKERDLLLEAFGFGRIWIGIGVVTCNGSKRRQTLQRFKSRQLQRREASFVLCTCQMKNLTFVTLFHNINGYKIAIWSQ